MKNYDRVNARRPEGIEQRRAHIVGGGIAGLSAAAFLVHDAHMPGANITVYDQLKEVGGSMDGAGNAVDGYVARGERELEPYMECLWYLFSLVPSLEDPTRTVLDETRENNKALPIFAKKRLFNEGFVPRDLTTLEIGQEDKHRMLKLMGTTEAEIEDVTIEQWFTPAFFRTNLWFYWSSMLAFQPYHSLIEMKRYTVRFMQHLDGVENLKGILRTKYDQYSSMILPLRRWLEAKGIRFATATTVDEIGLEITGEQKTVRFLDVRHAGKAERIQVGPKDLVFFTNGSMTQNSSHGDNQHVARMNTDTGARGCFAVWEKLARQSPVFGHPEKFISKPELSRFISFTVTITDYPELFQYLERKTESRIGESGLLTMVDSPWFCSVNTPPQPAFVGQPDNVQVLWGYGLRGDAVGTHVRKRMVDCTGEEILREVLFQLGYERADEVVAHSKIITSMLPFITSQFMPRGLKDRPEIIPAGCTNLACIGQFVELEGDVVFTVETSVRTAMIAVYRMLQLDKPITPLFEGQYDLRIIVACLKKMLGVERVGALDLLPRNPLKLPQAARGMLAALNGVPEMVGYYPETEQNR